MQLTLETNIGTVIYELSGDFVHVKTEQESAREFSLNLWDHATKQMRIDPSIDNVFLEVAHALEERFLEFSVNSASLEDLKKSAIIEANLRILRFNEEQARKR
jgi:hypothetical protein